MVDRWELGFEKHDRSTMFMESNSELEKLRGGDPAIIKSLPGELLVEVLARVASSSLSDLFNAKICCRDFLGATEDNYIFEHVSIEKFPVIHEWLKSEEVGLFLNRCKDSGNPEALFRHGMIEYFSFTRTESGIDHLRRAAEKGHVEASYVYGIILLCSGGASSEEGLKVLSAMEASRSRPLNIGECRERISAVLRSMWVHNNNIVVSQGKKSSLLCGHERGGRGSVKVRETWRGREAVEDDSGCEACKWDREVNYFCDLLPPTNV